MDGQNFENEVENVVENEVENVEVTANPAPEKKTDGLAIASLVLGILSIILVCCNTYAAIIAGIVSIVLAILSKKNNGKSGMSTAGLICSIVGIVLAIVMIILAIIGLAFLQSIGFDMNSLF